MDRGVMVEKGQRRAKHKVERDSKGVFNCNAHLSGQWETDFCKCISV